MTDSLEEKVADIIESLGDDSIVCAKQIIPIIKEEGIKEGLDAALTAYESTCQALIEEAKDSIRQAVEGIENPYPDKTRGFFGSAWRSASDYYGNKHGFNKAIQAVLKVIE